MSLCLSEVGPGGLMTAGSSSDAEHPLDWTLAGKSKLVLTNRGNHNRSKIHTQHQQNEEDTKSGAIYAENFIQQVTRQL